MTFQAKRLSKNSVLAIVNNKSYTFDSTHPNFTTLFNAVNKNDVQTFLDNIDIPTSVLVKSNGKITTDGYKFFYNGEELHNAIVERILELKNLSVDFEYMVLFLENIMANPSFNSREQLFKFIEHKNLPITPDGCILAYKAIQHDWYSKTAGTIKLKQGRTQNGRVYNGIGEVIECDRSQVDDNPLNHCSNGLHVGALEYVREFGWGNDRYVIVKVNPADIVSVPSYCSCQKVRCSRYEVVAEYTGPLPNTVVRDYDTFDDEYEEEYDDINVEFDELIPGDVIEFTYKNEIRTGEIVSIEDDLVTCLMMKDDPSVSEYRSFKKEKMSGIMLI